jgi:hypothetical protein
LVLLVVLALSAGLVSGLALQRMPAASAPQPPARTPLAEELRLSDEQISKMRSIWESVREKADSAFADAQSLDQARDDALFALLNDQQKAKFADIQKGYAEKLTKLKADRDVLFDSAVKQTEQILTDSQKKRYREILESRLDRKPADAMDWLPKPSVISTQAVNQPD